jgi:anti-sigma factor RsiW
MNGRVIKFEGSVHAQADRMLPWWVNGTLPESERQQVEQHLAECAQCQREVAWLRSVQDEYLQENTETGHASPMPRRLRRRLLEESKHAAALPASRWQHRRRRWMWLAAAQTVLIVVLGAALLRDRYPTYHTLSAADDHGALLAVVFDPGTSEAQLRQLLRASDARLVGGPTETGAYLLKVPGNLASQIREKLHRSSRVVMVENLDTGQRP